MSKSKNVEGALFLAVSVAAFAVSDSISKLLVPDINVGQIMVLRGIGTTILIGAVVLRLRAFCPLRPLFHPYVLIRLLCESSAAVLYITALKQIPLANASAILQATPLAVTLGASLFFGEPVGWRRWSAIFIGFAGVLVIVRPSADGISLAILLAIATMLAMAIRDLVTRAISPEIPASTLSLWTGCFVALSGAALVGPMGGWQPVSSQHLFYLAIASIGVTVGYLGAVIGTRIGEFSFVAPMRYLGLIFSAILGFLLFGELPDRWVYLGSAVVIVSGVYAFYREARARRRQSILKHAQPETDARSL